MATSAFSVVFWIPSPTDILSSGSVSDWWNTFWVCVTVSCDWSKMESPVLTFVGTGFSASDCVVEVTAVSCLLWTNSTVSLCKCITLHSEVSSFFSFLQFLWKPLGVLAEGNAGCWWSEQEVHDLFWSCVYIGVYAEKRPCHLLFESKQSRIQKKRFLEHFSEVNHDFSV